MKSPLSAILVCVALSIPALAAAESQKSQPSAQQTPGFKGKVELDVRDSVPDWTKLFFTGRLAAPNRNPEGLEAILREDLGVPVKLITFIGQWMNLPPGSLCSLGSSPENGLLGQTAVVGSRLWVGHFKFRLRIGPLRFREFRRLLPDASIFKRLKDWVLNYVGREFVWDANLILKAAEVPEIRLGAFDGAGLLGWTTWLKSRPFRKDADDLILIGDN